MTCKDRCKGKGEEADQLCQEMMLERKGSVPTYITLAIKKVNELKDRDHTPKPNLFFSNAHLTFSAWLVKVWFRGRSLVGVYRKVIKMTLIYIQVR